MLNMAKYGAGVAVFSERFAIVQGTMVMVNGLVVI
jgi:hypothetical protein